MRGGRKRTGGKKEDEEQQKGNAAEQIPWLLIPRADR
jgi:hypothetical protein